MVTRFDIPLAADSVATGISPETVVHAYIDTGIVTDDLQLTGRWSGSGEVELSGSANANFQNGLVVVSALTC